MNYKKKKDAFYKKYAAQMRFDKNLKFKRRFYNLVMKDNVTKVMCVYYLTEI